jgi:low temperature requirement protein LtrA
MLPLRADDRPHRRRRFTGRDPDEDVRASTPLELLYDLTIVVAFSTASDELAHYVAEGHVGAGVAGFVIAAFAVSWAWLNYTWFASAYDTDDWVFRLATMVQMVGVIVLSLGLPQMFASIDHGATVDNGVMVAGYVVMRVPLLLLWARVWRDDERRRPAARIYMLTIGIAQIGWVALALADLSVDATLALFVPLLLVELGGPLLAERKAATPWHAHHIAERYGLLVIITLGEVILGTVVSLNALVHGEAGWTVDAGLLAVAGSVGTVVSVALPFALYVTMFYALYSVLMRTFDPFHLGLIAVTAALIILSVVLAVAGANITVCLLVLALAPAVTVVGYEALGYRHMATVLERL